MSIDEKDDRVWEVGVYLDKAGSGMKFRVEFYNKDGDRVHMGCCGENKVPTPLPPATEPEPDPPPVENPPTNPPGTIPEEPVPPGEPVPDPDLPPPVEEPDPPPVEPEPEPEPEPPPVIPPGDPIPDPPPPDPPIIPEPPPESNEFNRVLEGENGDVLTILADVVIPAGEKWRFKNVEIRGNIRATNGATVAMRPGDRLKFIGIVMDDYVGGGMTWAPQFAKDYGIWIGDGGGLDLRGTPKRSWNRTGTDSTWLPTDEYYISPTTLGDTTVRPWTYGSTIPQIHASLPPAEIANVTRDVIIEGGHIHIHSHNVPFRIEYVRFEKMGISNLASRGPVSGRYVIHAHHNFDGSIGSTIKGCSFVNSRGRNIVPHMSHGITITDCVVVNSWAEGFWWDSGDPSEDTMVDRLCVMGVKMPESVSGQTSMISGIILDVGGPTNVMRQCAVSGCHGSDISHGFNWPEVPVNFDPEPSPVWTFENGNVAHNNEGGGIRFWNNNTFGHQTDNSKTYHNTVGIENGAYLNSNRYDGHYSYLDGIGGWFGPYKRPAIMWQSNPRVSQTDNPPRFSNSIVIAKDGPAMSIGHRNNFEADTTFEVEDCTLTPAAGQPVIQVLSGGHPWRARFTNINGGALDPDDFDFPELASGDGMIDTHIEIRGGSTEWDIDINDDREIIVTVI